MADAWGRLGLDVAERLAIVAEDLGYVCEAPRPGPMTNVGDDRAQREWSAPGRSEVPDVPFWQPRSLEYFGEDAQEEQRTAAERAEAAAAARAEEDANRPAVGPEVPPLSPWRRLEPMLRRTLTVERRSRSVDIAALMRCWVRGRHLPRLPRELPRVWAPIVVVAERQARAVPYWHDQEVVLRELRRVVGAAGVAVRSLPDGVTGRALDARGRPARLRGGEIGRRPVLVRAAGVGDRSLDRVRPVGGVMAQVHEVVRSADDDLDIDPALAACNRSVYRVGKPLTAPILTV